MLRSSPVKMSDRNSSISPPGTVDVISKKRKRGKKSKSCGPSISFRAMLFLWSCLTMFTAFWMHRKTKITFPSEERPTSPRLVKNLQNSRQFPPNTPSSNIAYAFFLGGIPAITEEYAYEPYLRVRNSTKARHDDYRGLLYNILVSVQILKDSGSRADFVLMVHMADDFHAELPTEDVRVITEMGIILKYVPPTPDVINEFSTLPFEKFRILDFVDYKRVLYMDADISPRCNLDYIMDLSIGENALLKPNLIVSIGNTPSSSKFFMLEPGFGEFMEFVNLIPQRASSVGVRAGWKPLIGWGYHAISWKSLKSKRAHQHYLFEGADSDQGVLYEWTKYKKKNVSLILGDTLDNWYNATQLIAAMPEQKKNKLRDRYEWWKRGPDKKATYHHIMSDRKKDNPLKQYSCFSDEAEAVINAPNTSEFWSPSGVPPYRDIEQWNMRPTYPWNMDYPPSPADVQKNPSLIAYESWFMTLKRLDQKHNMQLNLATAYEPWKYFPLQTKSVALEPIWSDGIKALRQWAYRITDTSEGYMSWEPPLLKERLATENSSIRSTCKCPTTATTDPCSASAQSLHDWLGRRTNYHLSRQRPLCPRAARHKINVVLSVHDMPPEGLQESVCTIACQNYPPEKLTITIHDDGSADNNLRELCGRDQVAAYRPLDVKNHDVSFEMTMEHAAKALHSHGSAVKTYADGMELLCLKSTEYIGSTGATYWALQFARQHTDPNDIVIVLGNQNFKTRNAIEVINEKFVAEGAMMAYGGEGGTGFVSLPNRKERLQENIGNSFSFKQHLFGAASLNDFTYKDRSWLVQSPNRALGHRLLELAGSDRAGFIAQAIFNASKGSSNGPLTGDVQASHVSYLESLKQSLPVQIPLHMVMVCPKSEELLSDQLKWLQEQKILQTRRVVLHLLSRKPESYQEIKQVVVSFRIWQSGLKPGDDRLVVKLVESDPEDSIALARFRHVNELQRQEPLDHVVLLDNNQYWPPDCIQHLISKQTPQSVTASYGTNYKLKTNSSGLVRLESYQPGHGLIESASQNEADSFVHAGHGGSVFDGNLWLIDKELLLRSGSTPTTNGTYEIWVSYVLDALLGWKIRRHVTETKTASIVDLSLIDGPSYAPYIPEQIPRQRLSDLSKLLGEAHHRLGERDSTKDFIFFLHETYHWNILRNPVSPMRVPDIALEPLQSYASTKNAPLSKVDGTARKRAFVCVTGQLQRLELENKIRNMFVPLQEAGFLIDVSLVVSGGSVIFTNAKTGKDAAPFFESYDDAVKLLQLNKINVLSHDDGAYEPLENPPVPKEYVDFMKASQVGRSREEQRKRAMNHARIFDSYQRCLTSADAEMEAFAADGETKHPYYDVFIRIRDDVGFAEKLSTKVLTEAFPPPQNSVIVTKCRSWQGMNDRFAVVSPDIARAYFETPFEIFTKSKRIYDSGAVRNPESFLLYVYTIDKIHVLGHPDLVGVNRIRRNSAGLTISHPDDVASDGCQEPDSYRKRFFELYGWTL